MRKSVNFTAGMMRATSSSTTNLSDIYDNKTRAVMHRVFTIAKLDKI